MGSLSFSTNGAFFVRSPLSKPRSRFQSKQAMSIPQREHHVLQVLAAANRSPGKGNPNDEVIMVDPLEAKRLAAKQMQEFKAKEKLKRQRRIEAINGAWAMIGLTAGLVMEGSTGNSILEQLAGYAHAIIGYFWR